MTLSRQARGFYATALDLSTPDAVKHLSQETGVKSKALREGGLNDVLSRDRFRCNKLCSATCLKIVQFGIALLLSPCGIKG